ncbi:hypothetical protein MGWOODY_Tha265 [hydrothermal vent metagenome]|uniref:Uncharacterized protein n=1 Tax=hydrothermal vent metagenome TaxID=652676 RepID=A0A160T934_9ZZZZ
MVWVLLFNMLAKLCHLSNKIGKLRFDIKDHIGKIKPVRGL